MTTTRKLPRLSKIALTTVTVVTLSGCAGMADMLPSVGSNTKVVDSAKTAAKYKPDLPANVRGLLASARVAAFKFDQGAANSAEYKWVDSSGRESTFSWSVGKQNATGAALADLLESTLAASGFFLVNVRGETFAATKEEKSHADDGWVGENEIQKGRMQSPDLMIKATVIEWSPNVKGGGAGVGALIGGALGGAKWENQVSRVSLQLQVVDAERQLIVVPSIPVQVEAKSTKFKAGALAGLPGAVVGGALSSYSNTPMEEAIALAIKTCVEQITTQLPESYFRHQL
ncbi:MAG: hypothetical protein IPK64_18385 [bacterium]|nr:hypothetical protein [bacterium]